MATPGLQFTIEPQGPFSLREAAQFGFGQRSGDAWDGAMRMAFCLDGYREQVGVVVRQDPLGVNVESWGSNDVEAICRQVARVLSLDHDGRLFSAIGAADPVVRRLQQAAPGLRPPLFYSPYEAAAWAVLSARRPHQQMARVRQALSEAHGRVFALAGASLAAFPTPAQMLGLDTIEGLPAEKVARLHGVAAAALEGQLDVERIQALGPEAALLDLQRLRGIGPFYASLVVIRASGFVDVLPAEEPRLLDLMGRLYGRPGTPTSAELEVIAERWKPMRTWVAVLIRAAGPRVLAAHASLGGIEPANVDELGDPLVADSRAVRLETRGRRSGRPHAVTVGFVEEPDGSLLVAAGSPDADWALNLLADPRCRATVGPRVFHALAEPLAGDDHNRAIRELILRYGTPSERLGSGPSFRLRAEEPQRLA